MMAFRSTRGGYEARVTEQEREMLMSLASDVIFMLGSDVEDEIERRSMTDDDPLAAFEMEVAGIVEAMEDEEHGEPGENQGPFIADSAIEALLPDMSEDPEVAAQLRELTEDTIANTKIDNLTTFVEGLRRVATAELDSDAYLGLGERVVVENDDANAWLGALNDIRLVLAARLEIHDDESATDAYERAGLFTSYSMRDSENIPEIETTEDMLAVLYAMTTWWLESLIGSVRSKAARR